jgi:hypothetical protein
MLSTDALDSARALSQDGHGVTGELRVVGPGLRERGLGVGDRVAAGLDVQDEVRGDGGDLLEVQRCGLDRRVWAGSRGGAEAEQLSAAPPSSGRHRVRVVVR